MKNGRTNVTPSADRRLFGSDTVGHKITTNSLYLHISQTGEEKLAVKCLSYPTIVHGALVR